MKLDEFIKHVEREREALRLTNLNKMAKMVKTTNERKTANDKR
jgi:hypothetical protein